MLRVERYTAVEPPNPRMTKAVKRRPKAKAAKRSEQERKVFKGKRARSADFSNGAAPTKRRKLKPKAAERVAARPVAPAPTPASRPLGQRSDEFLELLAPLPHGGFDGRIEVVEADDACHGF